MPKDSEHWQLAYIGSPEHRSKRGRNPLFSGYCGRPREQRFSSPLWAYCSDTSTVHTITAAVGCNKSQGLYSMIREGYRLITLPCLTNSQSNIVPATEESSSELMILPAPYNVNNTLHNQDLLHHLFSAKSTSYNGHATNKSIRNSPPQRLPYRHQCLSEQQNPLPKPDPWPYHARTRPRVHPFKTQSRTQRWTLTFHHHSNQHSLFFYQ